MKIIFNDATELSVQQANIGSNGSLGIKVLHMSEDELRAIFSDQLKTKKIRVVEQGVDVVEYDGYTSFEGLIKYNDGILEPFLYQKGGSPEERLSETEEKVSAVEQAFKLAVAELSMMMAAMLGGGEGGV